MKAGPKKGKIRASQLFLLFPDSTAFASRAIPFALCRWTDAGLGDRFLLSISVILLEMAAVIPLQYFM
jgi:hypothetical protein